jgi:hypothetical protein
LRGIAGASIDDDGPERASLSGDGRWWWDGARWVPTASEDGLWRWDGFCWRPTLDPSRTRPRELATTLTLLAEDRYAQAAAILVERTAEWRPEGELGELVDRAMTARQRLGQIDRALAGKPRAAGLGGLARRLSEKRVDRPWAQEQAPVVGAEQRALLVHIGRAAAPPTVQEADDLLEPARLLDARAGRLTQALTTIDEAERARATATELAQRELETAEAERRAAIAAAGRAVDITAEARAEAFRDARARLRVELEQEPDEVLAAAGPMRAYGRSVATPEGRLPVEGLVIAAGTAAGLWRQHREPLADLVALETAGAGDLGECLVERRGDLFLLLLARSRAVVWQCPPGQERAARRFARLVRRRAAGAAAVQERQGAAAREVEVLAAGRTAAAALEEARTALTRVQTDAGLLGAVQDARERLARAAEPPPGLEAAQRWVREEVRALMTPPERPPRARY